MRPNFLFIGPDKSGSTWIYNILRKHPDCYVPGIKDIYFFDRYYSKGISWYMRFFEDAPLNATAVGELSHDYLFSSKAANRIFNDLPNVKLITCLRNPIERTFSNYLQMLRNGELGCNFDDALKKYPKLIEHSMYSKHLSCYLNVFKSSQIKILLFDDLKKDSSSFAGDLFEFLEIKYIDYIDYNIVAMPASHSRNIILSRVVKSVANQIRKLGFPEVVGIFKRSYLPNIIYKAYKKDEHPIINTEIKQQLKEVFSKEIEILQEILKNDLKGWLSY